MYGESPVSKARSLRGEANRAKSLQDFIGSIPQGRGLQSKRGIFDEGARRRFRNRVLDGPSLPADDMFVQAIVCAARGTEFRDPHLHQSVIGGVELNFVQALTEAVKTFNARVIMFPLWYNIPA